MRIAAGHTSVGANFNQALLGWTLAAVIVLVAVFGPPLMARRIPTLVELRHHVLMIDREVERWAVRTNRFSARTEASRDT
jgi:hypothetical protein